MIRKFNLKKDDIFTSPNLFHSKASDLIHGPLDFHGQLSLPLCSEVWSALVFSHSKDVSRCSYILSSSRSFLAYSSVRTLGFKSQKTNSNWLTQTCEPTIKVLGIVGTSARGHSWNQGLFSWTASCLYSPLWGCFNILVHHWPVLPAPPSFW